MAYTITIPFFAFKLSLSEENYITLPLMDAQAMRLNEPLHLTAGKYAEVFQQKILNEGVFQEILNEWIMGSYDRGVICVDLKESKDKISYPAFSLKFDYFYAEKNKGFWGIVPALGVEHFSQSIEQLEKHLQETILLEFSRKQRLNDLRALLTTMWHERIDITQQNIDWRFPTLKELENLEEINQESLLAKVAQNLKISKRTTFGRKKELDQLTKALKGHFNRNVLLVGASGVGKTALIWETIRQGHKRKIEGNFWESTASILIKELSGDTGWQDNLAKICRELSFTRDILFIRSFMELFEVGQYVGNSVSMADYLRPYISRGDITLISECTEEEYAKIELRSPNYLSFFQVIRLEEPKEELESIIVQKVNDLAANRKLQIEPGAIKEILRLNRRFSPYAGLPGKPIRFLESILINQKRPSQKDNLHLLTGKSIIKYFSEETGIPIFMIDPQIAMDSESIRTDFSTQVFGQEKAVNSIVDLLASVKTALTRTGKPIASFLFVGPTGVGKTELAKVLANFMFGNRARMLRFDMSEFSDPYAVMRLTGTDYSTDGLLTSAVHQEPFCVLLFDEIEKAHTNFFDLLLQVLSEGRLTDSKGKLVNFCSTIIIMTSNIGASNLQSNRISLQKNLNQETVTTHFMSAVQQFFRPELFGRIDEVIPFVPLSKPTIRAVIKREIALFKKLEGIQFRRLELNIREEVYGFLADMGYSPAYGARKLQRSINEYLIIPLAKQLNVYDNQDQLIANIGVNNNQIEINIEADPLGLDLLLEELEKIDNADFTSELRRKVMTLEEGKTFIKLQSELEILERKKRIKGKKFWNNRADGERISYLLEVKEQMHQLKSQINDYEDEMSTAFLGIRPYDITITERLTEWRKVFFNFKINLYSKIYIEDNQTFLAIYGINPVVLQEIYTYIAKHKQFEFAIQTIWYRTLLYNTYIEKKEIDDSKTKGLSKGRNQTKEYAIIDYDVSADQKFTPKKEGDLLCGITLRIKGDCANLFFKNETGIHLFKPPQEDSKKFFIQVSESPMDIPDGIHRREFYAKKPIMRIYQNTQIEDKAHKWAIELKNKEPLAPTLLKKMDETFEQTLDSLL